MTTPKVTSYREIMESFDKYNTYRTIYLDTICNNNERYIEFETNNVLILFDINDFLNYASYKLNDTSLCFPKKQYLEFLMDTIKCYHANNLYFIESMFTPESWKQMSLPNSKKYKKTFIPPYGYESKIDTVNKKRLITLKHWIISDLCINGKCLILDKRQNSFAEKIFYVITNFKNGHGGEQLLFEDKKPFFNVAVYSDIILPNFDCMSSDEIKKWNEDVQKRRK